VVMLGSSAARAVSS